MSEKDKEDLAEMKDQLYDPNIKNNPQLKSQIEKSIAMMEGQSGGGDALASMMPKGVTVKMKNGNSAVAMESGMMKSRYLVRKAAEGSININDEKRLSVNKALNLKATTTLLLKKLPKQPKY